MTLVGDALKGAIPVIVARAAGFRIWRLVAYLRTEIVTVIGTSSSESVLATLIDTACGFAGCYCAEPGRVRRAVTLTMSTSFLGQAAAGDILTAKARRTGGGKNIFFTRCA